MSDVVRVFNRSTTFGGRRRRWRAVRRTTLIILGVIVLWAWWVTRDRFPMGQLIPAQQAYECCIGDPLGKRTTLAQSQLWSLAPKEAALAKVPELLANNFGLPEWVLNNLVYGLCHVSGNDLREFRDPLLVTRMSRIGCLLEKLHHFIGGIEQDCAGGLNLRVVPAANLFYAVRGRVLLLSPSRDALIHALTLTAKQAIGRESLAKLVHEMGSEGLSARINFRESDPLGDVFESARIDLQVRAENVRLVCQNSLRPAWKERFAALLEAASPQSLQQPPEGYLMVSANFGKSITEVWAGIQQALGDMFPNELLAPVSAKPELTILAECAKVLGPGFCLSWVGVDQNEMLPAPELAGVFDTNVEQARALLATIPAPPEGTPPWASYPRYDAASGIAFLPLIGGPSMQPSMAIHGNGLMASSSRTVLENLLAQPTGVETLPQPGNLFIRLNPAPAWQCLVETAMPFVEFGLVRGYTPETFKQFADSWSATFQRFNKVSVLAAHNNGTISAELEVAFK
ncbi:MAG TPA: hypothetical protein PLI09_01470 [Candidatus Hydrogenedentes bacterium]|nr:hypothetical protein [Candidatus Hydrogenedentota bacterium]